MGVYIKGMKMPTSCASCDIACRHYLDHGLDGLLAKICHAESRLPDCPLVPVPPHGRLIDADAVEKQIDYVVNLDWNIKVGASGGMLAALEIVEDAPTIIEAEDGE